MEKLLNFKLLYLFIIILLMIVNLYIACDYLPEHYIKGTWKLDTAIVENIDALADSLYYHKIDTFDKQINSINTELTSLDSNNEVNFKKNALLERTKQNIEFKKNQMSTEDIKSDILNAYSKMIGDTILILEENKTSTRFFFETVNKGTWDVDEKGSPLIIFEESNYQINIDIIELTAEIMVVNYSHTFENFEAKTELRLTKKNIGKQIHCIKRIKLLTLQMENKYLK